MEKMEKPMSNSPFSPFMPLPPPVVMWWRGNVVAWYCGGVLLWWRGNVVAW